MFLKDRRSSDFSFIIGLQVNGYLNVYQNQNFNNFIPQPKERYNNYDFFIWTHKLQ